MTPIDPRRDGRAAHFGTMSAATVPRMWSGFNCASISSPCLTFEPRFDRDTRLDPSRNPRGSGLAIFHALRRVKAPPLTCLGIECHTTHVLTLYSPQFGPRNVCSVMNLGLAGAGAGLRGWGAVLLPRYEVNGVPSSVLTRKWHTCIRLHRELGRETPTYSSSSGLVAAAESGWG